ncbi:MAG: zinc-dependent alcohol dehydrogenase [Actinomycetota bacterium]
MRAVQVRGPGDVELAEVPRPEPGHGDVLVRVETAAICATDRRLALRGADAPRIPGHEAAGHLEDGTPVGVHPDVGCGHCEDCRSGFENRCADRRSMGLDQDGCFAEWVAVPSAHAVSLETVDLRIAPFLEPLACCLHAIQLLKVRPGTLALVVGAGSMGVLCMWALKAAGAVVAVVQRSEPRRRMALELGADAALWPEDDPQRHLGTSPEVAVVTAPGVEALVWALKRVAPGGRVHAFAGTPGGAFVDANLVHYRHVALLGSTGSTVVDYVRARDLVAAGDLSLEPLPRTEVSLAEAPGALLGNQDPTVLKTMLSVNR